MIYLKALFWLVFIVLGAVVNSPQGSIGLITYTSSYIFRLFGLKKLSQKLKKYGFDQGVSYDQNINTFCLGKPDETISSRVGFKMLQGDEVAFKVGAVIDVIFKLLARQSHHSVNAIEWHKIYSHVSKQQRIALQENYFAIA